MSTEVFINKFSGIILNPPLDSCFPSSTELLLIVSIGKFDNQIFISCSESFYQIQRELQLIAQLQRRVANNQRFSLNCHLFLFADG